MNSQDITRALIDTTVARAMVEMDADPKRSVRKLCDLGRQFSRGRFQNQIFAIFQDLLRNDESPYYQAIDFLLRSNDPEALRQFGINIGYNSFTYGAQILRQKQKELSFAVPWVVKLRLDSRIPDTYDSSFFASVVRTGLTYGIYSYQLRSMDHHEDMESYLAVIQSHPECAFLWFLSDTPLTEKQQKLLLSCPNLMVSLPIDAPSTASMAKALRRQRTLFGMHKVYQDADAAAYLLSFDHLYSQMVSVGFRSGNVDVVLKKIADRLISDRNLDLVIIKTVPDQTDLHLCTGGTADEINRIYIIFQGTEPDLHRVARVRLKRNLILRGFIAVERMLVEHRPHL